ncbi:MAG TPA: DNA adenine methylase, partial [Dongiaceae bacterium]|nr:DNA adenine methylase [Dongiaceae bacterium]
MEIIKLRPPLTYYGGKQTLAPLIVQLIPEHILYGEPFTGGAAVFFAKPPSKSEVINDTNGELVNFYRVIKEQFSKLKKEIDLTLHSRDSFRKAMVIYNNPDMFDEIKRAWAVWVICSQAFSSKMNGPWGFDKTENSMPKRNGFKKSMFTDMYIKRLERTSIECADALYIIKSRDHEGAFFYCDPPYFNSNMGHYGG